MGGDSMNGLRRSDFDLVHSLLRSRLEAGLRDAREAGLAPLVFETYRSRERQEALYALGRTKPGKIVTNARPGKSWHQYGLAVDVVFDAIPETPKPEWTWSGNWRALGEIMMGHGLEWYGAPGAPFPEAPHFQLTAGLSITRAESLRRAGGLAMVWDEVSKLLGGQASG